ncbi:MAG: LpqB family beta-propeller domain-containing protein [Gemmatimonadaceae bacterium]
MSLRPRTRLRLVSAFVAAVVAFTTRSSAQAAAREATVSLPSFAEPSISPDRSEIAFVSGGDVWTVPASGGEARLLISHAANESRPLYSPDGRRVAFVSQRSGNGDIYVLTLASGELARITFDDGADRLDAWSRDGKWIYFSSSAQDISSMSDVFRVAAEGGTPMAVSGDRYASEYFATPGPDSSVTITARGVSATQWWRKGCSHLDEAEIWSVRGTATPRFERLTEGGAKEMWPMWSADGRSLYYVSDRGGAQNVWVRPVSGAPRQVTQFRAGRVLWPSISADGRAIVFERDFGIWTLDVASGKAEPVAITRRGTPAGPGVEHLTLTSGLQELALSPDGRKVAFVARGELFAASAKDGGDAQRITTSAAGESQPAWSPDSRRLVYVSTRGGARNLYLHDFTAGSETQLTSGSATDISPRFSPDGRWIAFERDAREIRLIDTRTRAERALATGTLDIPPFVSSRSFAWSPDSRWIAFLSGGDRQFTTVSVVPVAGGTSRPVSWLANVFSGTLSWSPDGTYLLYDSGQRTEGGQVARVDLIPRTPRFREDQFRDLFREETPRPVPDPIRQPDERTPVAPPPPVRDSTPRPASPVSAVSPDAPRAAGRNVEVIFDGIRRRLSLLPVGVDVNYQAISPDGKSLLMIASVAGQQNLYTYTLDDLARGEQVARQLTSTSGGKSAAQWSPDGKDVYYLEQGRIGVVTVESRQTRSLAVSAEMDVDFEREKLEVFGDGWRALRDNFFDAKFNGVDWDAVRAEYAPRIAGARSADEMRRLMQLMVGELNASHLGVSAPGGAPSSTGRLGLRFDRAEYEANGRLRITEIVPLGPAALARSIGVGDVLLAVDGRRIGARTSLDELLAYKIDRRVVLTVSGGRGGAGEREVVVRPTNAATEKGLLYRAWVDERRAYVARASGGRLGYVHMFDMSAGSLSQLFVDLDAENQARDGVVIDVRNNNGGFVNPYAIDVFARRGYMTMTSRGFSAAPARTVLGQRSLEVPTVLVTNQHSLSDAEDFTEGYRRLALGKVVGEPTAGWIIFTSNVTLLDGTSVRLPFSRIRTADGEDMEMHPRPVDVAVERPIGESYTGRDSQLDAAVRQLLSELDRRKATGSK